MIKVKLNNQFPSWPWLRQTPESKGIWKDAQFFVNDDSVIECDYFVVLGGLLKDEVVICPEENTILIALENKDIHQYNQIFLNQFHTILTHREDIKHKNIKSSIFPAYWFLGINPQNHVVLSDKSYDFFRKDYEIKKTKLISVISSNRTETEGHRKRVIFVEKLKATFGEKLDVYGRGINDFKDKWDVLSPYKYHITLENSNLNNEITEKLFDTILAKCVSFYHGAPNVNEYFDQEIVQLISLDNADDAIKIIKKRIEKTEELNLEKGFREAKENILNHYNLFEIIYKILSSHSKPHKKNIIKSEESLLKIKKNILVRVFNRFKRVHS